MSQLPNELLTLIAHLKKFPGVGRKTAERFAFHLLNWPKEQLKQFADDLGHIQNKIFPCPECGCLKGPSPCTFCNVSLRDVSMMCLISSPRDVYAIEETKVYKGLYHVIGGLLSPLEGRFTSHLGLEKIQNRLEKFSIKEVIIAFDSTLEADATALYLKEKLNEWGIVATRLAFGLPMGSSLDYVDYGTLEKAFTGRRVF